MSEIDEIEEWPDDECLVTPEMVSAGVGALESGRGSYGDWELVSSVYRAMWEARPLDPLDDHHIGQQFPKADG